MSAYRAMLDTNIVSDLMRNPGGPATHRAVEAAEAGGVCISTIVLAELRYGIEKLGSQRLAERLEGVLSAIDVVPFDASAASAYGTVRADLQRSGTPIGATDLLIAAHALALGLPLATANVGEFKRVAGLKVENWLSN